MAALEGNKDDRHVGQGWGSWPGTLAGLGILPQALHAPPTLVWVPSYPHHTNVLPSLQGNRSLPKEAQGSHYITRPAGWGGQADITASPGPGPTGAPAQHLPSSPPPDSLI